MARPTETAERSPPRGPIRPRQHDKRARRAGAPGSTAPSPATPPRGHLNANARLTLLAALFVAALLGTGSAVPWLDNSVEYKVKAAFLYNFAHFVTWPEEAFADEDGERAPLVVGVLGEDPFGPILDATLKGKSVGGRELELRRYDSIKNARGAHLLFISQAEKKHLDQILPTLRERHTFCVSEIDEYATSGGIARFYIRLGRTAFEINKGEAERRGLKVSSQLLKLATIVETAEPEEEG